MEFFLGDRLAEAGISLLGCCCACATAGLPAIVEAVGVVSASKISRRLRSHDGFAAATIKSFFKPVACEPRPLKIDFDNQEERCRIRPTRLGY
jgi:hypothetical protein